MDIAPGMRTLGWAIDPITMRKTLPALITNGPTHATPRVQAKDGALHSYQVPDWAALTPVASQSTAFSVEVTQTAYQEARHVALSAGVETSGPLSWLGQLVGTGSVGADRVQGITRHGTKEVISASTKISLYTLSVQSVQNTLSPELLSTLKQVMQSDQLDFWTQHLFSQFGTHMVEQVDVGGSLFSSSEVDASDSSTIQKDTLKLSLGATLQSIALSGTASASVVDSAVEKAGYQKVKGKLG